MGSYLSKGMEGMMKEMTRENQEFMLKAQQMQVSRNLYTLSPDSLIL